MQTGWKNAEITPFFSASGVEYGGQRMDEARVNNQWRSLVVPPICERMIGFSIPKHDVVLIISYEGMHRMHLSEPITVTTDEAYAEYDCYNPDLGIAEYAGENWEIIGLFKGRPTLNSPRGEELRLDEKGLTISIWKAGEKNWSSPFKNFSGDWVAATFSPEGNYIVLGCPYDFDFRVWQRR